MYQSTLKYVFQVPTTHTKNEFCKQKHDGVPNFTHSRQSVWVAERRALDTAPIVLQLCGINMLMTRWPYFMNKVINASAAVVTVSTQLLLIDKINL